MSSRVSVALRFVLAGLFCLGMAAGVVAWVTAGDGGRGVGGVDRTPRRTNSASAGDPGSKTADGLVIDPLPLDDSGVALATRFTGVVRDPNSMDQLRDAIKARGRVGLAVLAAELDQLHLSADSPPEVSARGGQFLKDIGMLSLYEGKFAESSAAFRRALDIAKALNAPPKVRAELTALAGIASLRRGEVENCLGCVGPSSCIFPVAKEAVHLKPDGSREAIKYFTDYLNEWPGDLRVRWALNFA